MKKLKDSMKSNKLDLTNLKNVNGGAQYVRHQYVTRTNVLDGSGSPYGTHANRVSDSHNNPFGDLSLDG